MTEVKKSRLQGISILVVDDANDNRCLIRLLLAREGAKVEEAATGQEAIEYALSHSFDVILMDLQMPLMDGYAALQALQEKAYTKPVIALTAHAMIEEKKRTEQAGFAGHVTKPVDKEELILCILNSIKIF